MKISTNEKQGKDRRRSYRIIDELSMHITCLSDSQYERNLARFEAEENTVSLTNEFSLEQERIFPSLRLVERKYPDVAKLFHSLEHRIIRLAKELTPDDEKLSTTPDRVVSLGQYGIKFNHDEDITPGTHVRLHLKFFPSESQMIILGVIIDANEKSKGAEIWETSIDFLHMHKADRERLIKHMHNTQMRELRARRDAELDQ